MTSLRHNEIVGAELSQPGDARPERSTADRLLDAARDSVLTIGWKRTTLTEVARRAGVSRMTVYRTYEDMAGLFGDLMTREWRAIADSVVAGGPADGPWPERLADGLVEMVTALRGDDLFRRILEVDPELVLPYLLDRPGRSQEALLALIAAGVEEGQAAGGVRPGNPRLFARSLILAAHGSLLSARTMTDDEITLAALDQELRTLVSRYLAP